MVELGITFLDEDGDVQGFLRIQGSELSFHGPLQGDATLCRILPAGGHETAHDGEKFRGSIPKWESTRRLSWPGLAGPNLQLTCSAPAWPYPFRSARWFVSASASRSRAALLQFGWVWRPSLLAD